MPVLSNPRHESFAQALAKGKSAAEAYTNAGYKQSRSAASRLSTNVNIEARVAELQGRVAKKAEITIESLAGELEEARSLAIKEKQTGAAVSATMGKAKLFGLGSEHRKISGTIQVVTITPKMLDGLNDDELDALEAAYPVLAKLGLIGGAGSTEAEAASPDGA